MTFPELWVMDDHPEPTVSECVEYLRTLPAPTQRELAGRVRELPEGFLNPFPNYPNS